jgi:alpha-tubulin suppressor-like RCC1 family protein
MNIPEPRESPLSRRALVGAAAWTAPAIVMTVASPAAAASAPSAPAIEFTKVPPAVTPGGVFGDFVISATENGIPVPAGTLITVTLTSTAFGDGTKTKQFPATGTLESVTLSGLGSDGLDAGQAGIMIASYREVYASAFLNVDRAPVAQSGNVYAWGYNASGEVGDGRTGTRTVPSRWLGSEKFTAITGAHGTFHAITTAGTIYATGYNAYGVLANGNTTNSGTKGPQGPALTLGGKTFVASRFAQANSCLDSTIWTFDKDGYLHAVGNNPAGNFSINDGSTARTQKSYPGYVPTGMEILAANPGRTIVSVSDAGWYRALYLLSDGTVWNAGANERYAMGNNGKESAHYLAAQTITSDGRPLTNIVEALATQDSSVYLDRDGYLWGAGKNTYGQLPGLGAKNATATFAVRLTRPEGKRVVKIWVNASDLESVFAKTADGAIYMAGNNTTGYGSIGTTSASVNAWSRVIVPAGKTVAHIEFGGEGGLYLMTDGSVFFAGKNDTGGPGTGVTKGNTTIMTQVPLPGPAIDIAGTYMDSYAVVVAA